MDLVLGQYRLLSPLGSSAFGEVFLAESSTYPSFVAVKFETTGSSGPKLLKEEYKVMMALQGGEGFPRVFGKGKIDGRACLVIELLGKSLYSKFRHHGRSLSLKTVLEVLDQSLDRLEFLHSHYYLHRDFKPQNLLFGRPPNRSTLYLIDFGLAKKYQNGPLGSHLRYREDSGFAGTAQFASLNTHLGVQQSRRDDVESLLFVACYLLRGRLPWTIKPSEIDQKYEIARDRKLSTTPEELFKGYSSWFVRAFCYVRSMAFEDKPDFRYLKKMVRNIAVENKITIDRGFECRVGNGEEKKIKKGMGRRSLCLQGEDTRGLDCKGEVVRQQTPSPSPPQSPSSPTIESHHLPTINRSLLNL